MQIGAGAKGRDAAVTDHQRFVQPGCAAWVTVERGPVEGQDAAGEKRVGHPQWVRSVNDAARDTIGMRAASVNRLMVIVLPMCLVYPCAQIG
jgi:hypothetical protein